ncbi:Protein of unknown function [Pyronema omphalodes CBS 100304]|uniref:TRF2-interacting telomeric protein/Rap1 C-terminal domain-containing protein n=1 Tax=Pyronema omphalodes (strain CBS 100304) TaxID=1076935 RepID=U4KZJ4_PYROM|nr:Protein of unknown function [Pyronema omphalodes CBS 100304]
MLRRKYPTLTDLRFWWAVEKTGNDRDLTLEVVKEWMEHKRLLEHPRVWTMADDLVIRGNDVRAIEEVIKRRGEEEWERRMKWVNMKAEIRADREAEKQLQNGSGRRK